MSDKSQYMVAGMSQLRSTTDNGYAVQIAKFAKHGRTHALLKIGGVIYGTSRNYEYDIREEPREHRAAWCRLTGVTNKALNEAVKAFDAERRKHECAEEVRQVRKDAAKLGYRLVKNVVE